jgi:DHA1 family bicyclomycin/chloramphenicol resistance-like MFS transporter
LRTTLGNFASLFRHKRVLSYMLASGFSFAGMFSFLSAGPFVYIKSTTFRHSTLATISR